MHLLYVDESGSPPDPNTRFFVLAGVSIFERNTHWVDAELTKIATQLNPADPSAIEFHGSPMRQGKEGWQNFNVSQRVQATVDALDVLGRSQGYVRVFASVIEKTRMPTVDILETSFANVAHRFDQSLAAMWHGKKKNPQRGLLVCDKATYEQQFQQLSLKFKHQGHSLGRLRNFAEVPLFLDSKASRLIQLADMVAYWLFRYYQGEDDRGYNIIKPYIYNHLGVCGLTVDVEPATAQKMLTLPAHSQPFPPPTKPPVPVVTTILPTAGL